MVVFVILIPSAIELVLDVNFCVLFSVAIDAFPIQRNQITFLFKIFFVCHMRSKVGLSAKIMLLVF